MNEITNRLFRWAGSLSAKNKAYAYTAALFAGVLIMADRLPWLAALLGVN